MNYLQPSEYELYGLPPTTNVAWVTAASAMIDAHCRRITLAINQYTERLRTESGQRPVQLTYLPLSALAPATSPLVSARARYATPRRGDLDYEADLWDVALAFGIPGTWVNIDVTVMDYFPETGEITLPVNVMGWAFTEIELIYTAGFETFPNPVMVACAQLVKNAQATPALNVKKNVVPDGMQLWYFSDSLMDATVQELLAPFVARRVG
jgi:hypothetical protein